MNKKNIIPSAMLSSSRFLFTFPAKTLFFFLLLLVKNVYLFFFSIIIYLFIIFLFLISMKKTGH